MLNPRSSSPVDVPDVALFQLTPYAGPRKRAKKVSTAAAPAVKVDTPELYVMPIPEQLTLELYIEREILPMLVNPIAGLSRLSRAEKPVAASVELVASEEWIRTGEAGEFAWSKESVHHLQIHVLWASMHEFTYSDNEREKWDVLKWIFKRVIRKRFEYGKPTVCWHQNDEPFSFHNCCLACGMDEDVIREGVRRNIDPKIIEAVEQVCTY